MANFKDLFHSSAYKSFMKKLLIYALIVFVLGIVFLICKWPGGDVMTITGGCILIFWLLFFFFGKIVG